MGPLIGESSGLCGIVGCITRNSPEPTAFDAARDRMLHRGPDDGGSLFDPPAYLGARRLAILDLSPDGHQPMLADGGDLAVVFNGEIYNFQELRAELEAAGHPFRSRADTEVLLHGCRAWGWQGLLQRIDGMFAVALWDRRSRTLHLARDRAGKKPLYYCHSGGALYFASTLDALRGLLPHRPVIDPRAVDAFLVYQAVPAPLTIFQGIEHLPPGHEARFSFDSGRLEVSRYWEVSYASKLKIHEAEALDELERLLERAVRRRLVSDVPLGSFLSGGVDSGLVTAMMARSMGRQVEAVTLGFEDPAFDERPFARRVAERVGARLHEYVLRVDSLQSLPAILGQYGQPIADVSIVPTYFVAKAARRHVTVVLNGDGGDELFGGYARPVLAKAAEAYRRMLPQGVRSAVARRAAAFPRNVADVLRAGAAPAGDAFRYDRGLREPRRSGRAYRDAFIAGLGDWDPDDLYRAVWDAADGVDDVDRALYGDFKTYLPDQLLVKMDVSTMAHSVEARSPLLDTALVEFAARLPTEVRLPGYETKHLLKRLAERHVPPEVIRRRKRGFVMPTDTWLAQDLARHVRAALGGDDALCLEYIDRAWLGQLLERYQAARPRAAQQVWTLWVLELWLRMQSGRLAPADGLDALLAGVGAGAARREVAAAAAPVRTADDRMRPPLAPARPALRVLEVGMGWFPEQPGGLNRVFYQLTHHLPAEGVEVEGFVQEMGTPAAQAGWAVRGMARPGTPFLRRLREQRAAFAAALRDRPRDLVASHFAPAIWPAVGLVDVPLVVHFHGPWALESRQEGGGRLKVRAAWQMERSVYRRASRFIVLSQAFADVLRQHYGVSGDLIRIVPGGVDTDRFAPGLSRAAARHLLGWPADRPTVVCVRRLVRRMGLENLLAAAALARRACPDLLLVIAGSGALRAELEARAEALGLDGSVRFAGRVPDEDLPLVYRAADLSVVPTVALEGFGLIVVESLASGTPVLGTPVGGIPEILRPLAADLVCESPAPEHLAERMVAGLQGRLPLPTPEDCAGYARRRYSWRAVARQVREVYEEAVGRG